MPNNQKYTYTIEIWYRDKNFEKDFMIREIISQSDEKAIEEANVLRRNIFKTIIKSKVPYEV